MQTMPASPMTALFEAQRDRLRMLAFRMLGSYADAEDVVQETWMRLARHNAADIQNLAGWLTTVVGRISLDLLRSRSSRPEQSYDEDSSEVVIVDDTLEPEECVALADSVGLALLIVLDSLGPSERLAFVLHDMFAVPFTEIGQILGKSADATKMIASRARRKVQSTQPPTPAARAQRAVAEAFRAAAVDGDFEALLRVLDPDVSLTVDTPGGTFVTLGATEVATRAKMFSSTVARHQRVLVDALPGYISWREDATPLSVMSFTMAHNRITAIHLIVDAARLAAMERQMATNSTQFGFRPTGRRSNAVNAPVSGSIA